jgi:hypothetical protein
MADGMTAPVGSAIKRERDIKKNNHHEYFFTNPKQTDN